MHDHSQVLDSVHSFLQLPVVVPDDFPRDPLALGLPGTQTKFGARVIDGKFVIGHTPEELGQRYLVCMELVDQLTAYVRRKLTKGPDLMLNALLDNVASRLPHQGWGLDSRELAWIERQLRLRFDSR